MRARFIDYMRKMPHCQEHSLDAEEAMDLIDPALSIQTFVETKMLIDVLTESQRKVIVGKYIYGYFEAELAQQLDISAKLSTVSNPAPVAH